MRGLSDEQRTLLREIGARLGREVQDRIADRREDPELWYHFHDEMLRTLPRRRVIARAIHRMLRRRMASWTKARKASERGGKDPYRA